MSTGDVAVILAATVTKLPAGAAGGVLVTGSHGGAYAARAALIGGIRAAIFHDAGIGRDEAGIGGLALFAAASAAAAAVSHASARIGDVADMMARGRISRANAAAQALGVAPGMACAEAAERLRGGAMPVAIPPPEAEARTVLHPPGAARAIVLVNSASLVEAGDRDAIVVTGSHGGLVGGDPAMALRTEGFAAAFNDAGIGIEQAGLGRLPALSARGIAAVTVAAASARIGEARSTFEEGVISAANEVAVRLGAECGAPLRPLLLRWAARG